jgi:hypothetical protein
MRMVVVLQCKACRGNFRNTLGILEELIILLWWVVLQCKECGGSSICEHKRQRSHCRECKGSSFCEHNRERYRCKVLRQSVARVDVRHLCVLGCLGVGSILLCTLR